LHVRERRDEMNKERRKRLNDAMMKLTDLADEIRTIADEEQINEKMEQGEQSKRAGYKAGNKINLEPFIETNSVKRENLA
jgi:hypothetical protein